MAETPLSFFRGTAGDSSKRPLIVFVHHFGGNRNTTWRQVEIVNRLGFDATTFNLAGHIDNASKIKPAAAKWKFFWNHAYRFNLGAQWARQVAKVLDSISGRDKIIYSFSGPSKAALSCIAAQAAGKSHRIVGWICDSGPFLDAEQCVDNMLRDYYGIKSGFRRTLWLAWMMLHGEREHNKTVTTDLALVAKVRPDFPILSLRGANDTIVPPANIDRLFKSIGQKGLNLENLNVVLFKDSGHLDAVKQEPELYLQKVTEFLGRFK